MFDRAPEDGLGRWLPFRLLGCPTCWHACSWGHWSCCRMADRTLCFPCIESTWPICSVPVTRFLHPKTPLCPEESLLVSAWQPIQLLYPCLNQSWFPDCRSQKSFFLALREDEQMVQLEEAYARVVAITELENFALSWAHLIWKGFLELLRWWVHSCMELGTCGRDVPTSMHDHELSRSPPDESFIDMLKQNCCLSGGPHFPPPAIVEVLQDYVTNYHKVWRLHLRGAGNCGGHGSTILPGPEKSLISCGSFGIVITPVEWVHFGQMALNLHWGVVDLHMAMLWMALSSRAI